MAKSIMYAGNTQTIKVTVTDSTTGDLISGANTTCTLRNAAKVAVAGCKSLTMTEADPLNDPGVYVVSVDASQFNPVPGTDYALYVTSLKDGSTVLAKQAVEVQELLAI